MGDWIKPRTVFAMMFYTSCIYLASIGKVDPKIIVNATMILLGFYFGNKNNGGNK